MKPEAPLSAQNRKKLDKVVTDVVILTSDMNTVASLAVYELLRSCFVYAVTSGNKKSMAKTNVRHHDTPAGQKGLSKEILRRCGEVDRELGAVPGFFGEVSLDVEMIRYIAAKPETFTGAPGTI